MTERPRGAVLAYHAIGRCSDDRHNLFVSEQAFEEQMAYLARRHTVASLGDVVEGRADRGAVAITFDDAYVSVFEAALPVLRRLGFPATVFVPTAHIGQRNTWDPPSACPLDIASVEVIRDASSRGFAIESHGHMHIDMASAHLEHARADLARSKEIIEDTIEVAPRFLAYPYGSSSLEVRDLVRDVGFMAAFSIDRPHEGLFAYERVQVTPGDGLGLFALKASGRYISLRFSQLGRTTLELRRRLLRRRSSKR